MQLQFARQWDTRQWYINDISKETCCETRRIDTFMFWLPLTNCMVMTRWHVTYAKWTSTPLPDSSWLLPARRVRWRDLRVECARAAWLKVQGCCKFFVFPALVVLTGSQPQTENYLCESSHPLVLQRNFESCACARVRLFEAELN